ncbi:hypothetical protein AAEX28_14605 [Lentisphaerota bacterium WC36G]|nr:hypothetical protein LJT99_01360 [Lentisphaerae bacterium WC36]
MKLKDGRVLKNKDFSVERVLFDDDNGKELKVYLKSKQINDKSKQINDLNIIVKYSVKRGEFFGRKQLEFDLEEGKKITVIQLAVEDLKISENSHFTSKQFANGLGQPVYVNDSFWGIEWPVAINRCNNKNLKLYHKPGWAIKDDYISKSAVFGVAEQGEVANVFIEQYVPKIRVNPVKMAVLYNSWYDVRSLKSEDLSTYKNTIDIFKHNLTDKYGIKVDYFVPDDGWQNRKSLYKSEEPATHKKLSSMINDAFGGGFGIWMPISGNRGFDHNWDKNIAKYEVIKERLAGSNAYCLSGKKYGLELRKAITDVMTNLDVEYFKLDNNWLYCDKDNHGHLPNSDSTVEEIFELFDYMRSINKKVYLNLTTRINISPWWLMTSDCLWMGGGDVGNRGEVPVREGAISYRDGIIQNNRQFQFPLNSIMTHGVIKGRYIYGFKNENERHFFNYIMMFIGRGVSMYELYFSPEFLNGREWTFLGQNLKWAKENQEVLYNNTRFLLGDVRKKQPYAYSHSKDNKVIVFVRNPVDNTILAKGQKVSLVNWKKISKNNDDVNIGEISQLDFDVTNWKNSKAVKASLPEKDSNKIQVYRYEFKKPTNWSKFNSYRLIINGLDDNSDVYLNGKKIGTHAGFQGVYDADGNEIKSRWHYNQGGYYKYSLNRTYLDINKDELKEKNVIVVKHFNRGDYAGFYRSVDFVPVEKLNNCTVELDISPKQMGFDKKYKKVVISEYYPNKANTMKVNVGDTVKLI